MSGLDAIQHDDPVSGLCPEVTVPDRAPVELAPPDARSVPPDDHVGEVEALAALLAEVVELAGDRAVFPGRGAQLAMGHESVCRAMLAEEDSR